MRYFLAFGVIFMGGGGGGGGWGEVLDMGVYERGAVQFKVNIP